jgi:glutathione S-transferase
MLTLFYAPGACSMAPHIVLEESGEKYEPRRMDLAKGEQKSPEYMKVHPMGRVPALKLDDGTPLTENTAILPYLGKRFGMWPSDPIGEAKSLSRIGYFAATVHPAHAHFGRPERYVTEPAAIANVKEVGLKSFHGYLQEIDGMLAGREWLGERYSVLDPYALVFYVWGVRRGLPVGELKNYTAFKDRMAKREAVGRVWEDEKVSI